MGILSVLFSGLALLAALASLFLILQEKKRSQKQNTAILRLIDCEKKDAISVSKHHTDEEVRKVITKIKCSQKDIAEIANDVSNIQKEASEIHLNVNDLMNGVVPDYEEAIKAKDAVNSFSKDIAALLNFDPVQVAKETRMRNRGGREDE